MCKELLSEILEDYYKPRIVNNTRVEYYIEFCMPIKNIPNSKWIQENNSFYLLQEMSLHELAHRCIVYAWNNMYEITLRVMGAEIMCLKTGEIVKTVYKNDIKYPELFDNRFVFKACQWILENKDI